MEDRVAEAYRIFPDDVEPIEGYPAGRIVVNRGDLRYAFLAGASFADVGHKREIERLRSEVDPRCRVRCVLKRINRDLLPAPSQSLRRMKKETTP
jgi:hypothetical protein